MLVESGIERLQVALLLARTTARAMRQNLGAAVIYNLLAVPLAASGFVAPAMAAGLMIASSLSVTLNATRLAWGHPALRKLDRSQFSSADRGAPRTQDILVCHATQPSSPAT